MFWFILFYSFWSRKTNCCFVYSKGGYDRKRRVKRNSPFITFITWPSLLNDIYVWFSCGFGTKRKYVSHTRLGEWSQAYRGSPDQVVCQSPSACLTFPTHALFLCFPVIESVSGDCCNFSFSCVCAQISCFPWRVWHCCNAVLGQGQAVVLTWHGSLSWEPNFAFFSLLFESWLDHFTPTGPVTSACEEKTCLNFTILFAGRTLFWFSRC